MRKGKGKSRDIAIIGMACMFPAAPDLDTFWQNIVSKVDAITDPPPEAWDSDIFYDPDSNENDRVYCKKGGYLGSVAHFNPLQHGVMPRSVEGGEPDQWLALQVARDALADAGYPDGPPERHRTAVILGKGTYINRGNLTMVQHSLMVDQTLQVLKALLPELSEEALQLIRQDLKRGLPPFNTETAGAMVPNIVAGRIANKLDLMGPSYTVDAACASSLVAVEIAVRGLREREFDMALVGGVQVTTPIPILTLFSQLKALSFREQIRPFDKDADGTILGEGLGIVVLKRLEDAKRDGDRIYAIIKGVGTASDGRGQAVLAPRVEGEELALRRAYEDADISPRTVGLIEAHGTATLVGDATEVKALTRVFGQPEGEQPWCALGTVKSMIGHAMPAAGIAGLIKAALALYHRVLPPTLNVDQPSPRLELAKTPFYINTETRPWVHGANGVPRRAGVNAFGFGGINAHVILEEHPVPDESALQSRHLHWDTEVCILRGASRADLIRQGQELQRLLQAQPEVALKDLAYTLNVHSSTPNVPSPLSLAIVASSLEDLQQKLDQALKRLSDPSTRQIKTRNGVYFFAEPLGRQGKLAFLFPGEGAQYVNMLADLCMHFPEVRRVFDDIDRAYADHPRGFVPSDVIFPRPAFSEEERKKTESRIWQMDVAIEAILTANHALFTLLSRLGLRPDALLGHSVGEYSAMRAAGMLGDDTSFGQRLRELNWLYEGVAVQGGIPAATLVAVGASRDQVAAIARDVDGDLYVAMDNCPHQAVLVGNQETAERALEQLRHQGLIYEVLRFDRPYHTPLFAPYMEVLRAFLTCWIVAPPQIPLYSCTIVAPYPSELAEVHRVAFDHWIKPVEFRQTVETMYADGFRVFVEVGPRGNLTAFVDDILRGRPYLAVPANVTRHSGITQLNHLVGLLAAHGVSMNLEPLYARRSPRKLDLDRPTDPTGDGKRLTGRVKLATGWPPMSISEETAARVRARISGLSPQETGRHAAEEQPLAVGHPPEVPGTEEAPTRPEPVITTAKDRDSRVVTSGKEKARITAMSSEEGLGTRPAAAQVMAAYLRTMEQFLKTQQEVMQAYLTGSTAQTTSGLSERPSSTPLPATPSPAEPLAPEPPPVPAEPPSVAPSPAPGPAPAEARESPSSPPPEVPEPAPVAEPRAPDATAIQQVLLRLVSERTGYPPEMLDLHQDLEADLGIDSIKRVEIVGALQKELGLQLDEDLDHLTSSRTLQEMVDFLTGRPAGADENTPSLPTVGHEQAHPAAVQQPLSSERGSGPAPRVTDFAADSQRQLPFVQKVVTLTDEEAVAQCAITLDAYPFLRHHTLGRQISLTDPDLPGLPIMPLTMSVEMLVQAAQVLVPDRVPVAVKHVRAYRWMALEDGALACTLHATRDPSGPDNEVHVQVYETSSTAEGKSRPAAPIVEGTVLFAASYPAPPRVTTFPLRNERPSRWQSGQLYKEGMFHGPAFQGVLSMDRWGEDGAEATLRVLPPDGLFGPDTKGELLTDPVLLDQPGQVVAFWMAEHLESGCVIFPFYLEELQLYGPLLPPHEHVRCLARITMLDSMQVRSNLDIVRGDGRVWARFVGWEDRRFDVPRPIFRLLLSSQEVILSEPWPAPVSALPGVEHVRAFRLSLDAFPKDFFTAHGGLWLRVLAHTVLSRRERDLWRNLKTPPARRLEWLLGRIVAKDAVRRHLQDQHGLVLCPADVEILPDANGRPLVQGAWQAEVSCDLMLSIAHTAGVAVAVVGDCTAGIGVGVDIEHVGYMNSAVEAVAFTSQERQLLSSVRNRDGDEWSLRLWCAKEAVAKALGQGMVGGPQALVVQDLDVKSGRVQIGLGEALARRVRGADNLTLTAFTRREGDFVVATSLYTTPSGRPEKHETSA